MKREVGVWIDHRNAVIVTIENKTEVVQEILSHMEKHVRFSSGTHSKSTSDEQGSTAEDMRDRQFEEHLGRYYDEVISLIRKADSIWILGPGEAKVELQNRLKAAGLAEHIVGIETADKMTNNQIAAKVRAHYKNEIAEY